MHVSTPLYLFSTGLPLTIYLSVCLDRGLSIYTAPLALYLSVCISTFFYLSVLPLHFNLICVCVCGGGYLLFFFSVSIFSSVPSLFSVCSLTSVFKLFLTLIHYFASFVFTLLLSLPPVSFSATVVRLLILSLFFCWFHPLHSVLLSYDLSLLCFSFSITIFFSLSPFPLLV